MSLFDDILSNQELADDTKFQIGNHEVTLGDLRGQVTERDTRLRSLSEERDGLRGRYDELAANVGKLLTGAHQAVEQQERTPPPQAPADILRDALRPLVEGADPAEPLFQDKVFGSFANRLRNDIKTEYEGRFKELTDSFNTMKDLLNNGMQAMTMAQVQQDYKRWYDANRSDVPKGQDGKKVPLQQITDYAARNGMYQVNAQGQLTQLLDLDRALDTLTAPTRRQIELENAQKEAYDRGVRDSRANAGKVIPFMSERSAGGAPKEEYNTSGKSPRQIIRERLQQGLTEISDEVANQ